MTTTNVDTVATPGEKTFALMGRTTLIAAAVAMAIVVLPTLLPTIGATSGLEAGIRLAEAGIAVAFTYGCARGRIRFQMSSVSILLLLLIVWSGFEAWRGFHAQLVHPSPYPIEWGGTTWGSVQILCDRVAAVMLVFLVAALNGSAPAGLSDTESANSPFQSSRAPGIVAGALEAAAVGVTVTSAMEWFWDRSPDNRLAAGWMNPNLLASFLCLSLPVTVAMGIRHRRQPVCVAHCALAIAQAIELALTGSRGALLGVGISLACWGAIAAWSMLKTHRLRATYAAIAAVAALVAIGGVHGRLGGFAIDHTRSDQQRRVVWHAAAVIVRDHPLLGIGLGAFPAAMQELGLRERNPDTPDGLPLIPAVHAHAHNILLHAGAEGGIPFAVLVIAFLLASARGFAASIRKKGSSTIVLAGFAAALASLLVQNMFDYTPWYAPILLTAAALLGAAQSPKVKPGPLVR